MADGLGYLIVIEFQAHAVGSDYHSKEEEQQQRGSPEVCPDLGDKYGEKHQNRCQEEQVVGQEV